MATNTKMLMNVNDVMETLDVSQSYAYKLIRNMNKELESKGYHVFPGRVSRKFFFEHFYGEEIKEGRKNNARI